MELLGQTKFGIRVMTIDDYEKVYSLWMSCKNMGFNNLDDSREGIAKYLKRNPSTCFVAEQGENIVGVILSGHDGRIGGVESRRGATDETCQSCDALVCFQNVAKGVGNTLCLTNAAAFGQIYLYCELITVCIWKLSDLELRIYHTRQDDDDNSSRYSYPGMPEIPVQ